MKKIILVILGAAGILLGGLWLLQGLDLVRVRPILCVGACEPLEGGSAMWAVVGLLVLAAGAFSILRGLRGARPAAR